MEGSSDGIAAALPGMQKRGRIRSRAGGRLVLVQFATLARDEWGARVRDVAVVSIDAITAEPTLAFARERSSVPFTARHRRDCSCAPFRGVVLLSCCHGIGRSDLTPASHERDRLGGRRGRQEQPYRFRQHVVWIGTAFSAPARAVALSVSARNLGLRLAPMRSGVRAGTIARCARPC